MSERTSTLQSPSRRKKMTKEKLKTNLYGYLFIAPYLIGLFAFTLIPILYSFYLSFTDYNVLSEAKWVGISNYISMFTEDEKFWTSFVVTVKFAFVQVPLKLAFALLVAVILSRKTKLTNAYRTAFYIPSLIGGGVGVALTWKRLWGSDGVINRLLALVGIPGVSWLNETSTALYVLILLGVWQFGSQMLVFLAGINEVPASLHEAAIVDGAGSVKRFFRITLPMITPCIFFNLVNGIIGSMQAFGSAFLISGGAPLNSTLYFGLYQYQQAFQYMHMGYASAMAWFMMIVILILTAFVFRSSSGWVYYQDDR